MKLIQLLLPIALFLFILTGISAHAEIAPLCNDSPNLTSTNMPCQVDAEESSYILNEMLLQNSKFHRLVKKSHLNNPNFEEYRVLMMEERWVTGCGPGTSRSRTVYQIQIVVQSTDHGPTKGQEPHLITTYLNTVDKGYYSEKQYVSHMENLGFVDTDIDTFPITDSKSPVIEMMKKEIESPCSK